MINYLKKQKVYYQTIDILNRIHIRFNVDSKKQNYSARLTDKVGWVIVKQLLQVLSEISAKKYVQLGISY